jgi:V8-like Glu-specific endopeptidase
MCIRCRMAADAAKLGPAAYRAHRMEVGTGYVYQGPIPTHAGLAASPGYRGSAHRRRGVAGSPAPPLDDTNSTGGRRLREIFGKDDRKEVFLSSAYPAASVYSAIGQLVGTGADGKLYTCSGTLVAWNAVLTAGHCVYFKGWSKGLRFYPGRSRRNGKSRSTYYDPYGSWPATDLYAFSAWTKSMNMKYDVGIVTLGSVKGYSAGDFAGGYMYLSEGSVKGTLQTAGYPGEQPFGSMWRTQCQVKDTNANDQVIKTTACDMTSGDSGSAAWVGVKMSGGRPGGAIKAVVSFTVCSIASCSPTRCCDDAGFNGLVQLSHALVKALYKWIDTPY